MPRALDGLAVDLVVDDRPLRVVYAVGARGAGPKALVLNGTPLAFDARAEPVSTGRRGGADGGARGATPAGGQRAPDPARVTDALAALLAGGRASSLGPLDVSHPAAHVIGITVRINLRSRVRDG